MYITSINFELIPKNYKRFHPLLYMDLDDVVHITTTKEEEIKKIAMELANDTGRKILEEIYSSNTITASELSEKLKIPLPTVLFHLERLTELNLIKITDTKLSKKFREVKYYSPAKKAILIIPAKEKETILSIKNALQRRIVAPLSLLIAFGITVVVGWFTQQKGEKGIAEKALAYGAERTSEGVNTFYYFLLGALVLSIVFVVVYIVIQKRK